MDISWVVAKAALTLHITKDPDVCFASQHFRVHLVQERGNRDLQWRQWSSRSWEKAGISAESAVPAIQQQADIVDPPYSSRFCHLHHWSRPSLQPHLSPFSLCSPHSPSMKSLHEYYEVLTILFPIWQLLYILTRCLTKLNVFQSFFHQMHQLVAPREDVWGWVMVM